MKWMKTVDSYTHTATLLFGHLTYYSGSRPSLHLLFKVWDSDNDTGISHLGRNWAKLIQNRTHIGFVSRFKYSVHPVFHCVRCGANLAKYYRESDRPARTEGSMREEEAR